MNAAASHPGTNGLRIGLPRSGRFPVLDHFRTNAFRILRLQPGVGVDQAIWQAEESLTLLRAGLPSPRPDLLPWLPEPDEPEIRQAVQRIEEPLQRLLDELFWFDLEHDPDGDLLRRALAELDPSALDEYLARGEPDGLPRVPVAAINHDGTIEASPDSAPATGTNTSPDRDAPVDAVAEPDTEGVPRLLNQANLRLLLAGLSIHDFLPGGMPWDDQEEASGRRARRPRMVFLERPGGLPGSTPARAGRQPGGAGAREDGRSLVLRAGALDAAGTGARIPGVRPPGHRPSRG